MSAARRTPADIVQLVFNAVYQKMLSVGLIDRSQAPQNRLNGAQEAFTRFSVAQIAKVATQFAFIIQSRNPPAYRRGSGVGSGKDQSDARSLTADELDELNKLLAAAVPRF